MLPLPRRDDGVAVAGEDEVDAGDLCGESMGAVAPAAGWRFPVFGSFSKPTWARTTTTSHFSSSRRTRTEVRATATGSVDRRPGERRGQPVVRLARHQPEDADAHAADGLHDVGVLPFRLFAANAFAESIGKRACRCEASRRARPKSKSWLPTAIAS